MAHFAKTLFSHALRGLSNFLREMANNLDNQVWEQDRLDHLSHEKYGVPFSELDETQQSAVRDELSRPS